jgi:hypothetical protein
MVFVVLKSHHRQDRKKLDDEDGHDCARQHGSRPNARLQERSERSPEWPIEWRHLFQRLSVYFLDEGFLIAALRRIGI